MNHYNLTALSIVSVLGLASLSGPALAQQKTLNEQLVGTWSFVKAEDTYADGKKNDRWGPNPKGSLMFDANGRFMQIISRSDIPKFKANKVNMGTAEENKSVIDGMVITFGTYTVNASDKMLITRIEGGIYPNSVGTEQKRIISSLTSDELKYTNPNSSTGTSASAEWKRAK